MKNIENEAILLVDSHYGVYIPNAFYKLYNPILIGQMAGNENQIEINVDNQTWEDLSSVNNEHYWESWESVLNNTIIYSNGEKYVIIHNEDLWAIPESCIDQVEEWII